MPALALEGALAKLRHARSTQAGGAAALVAGTAVAALMVGAATYGGFAGATDDAATGVRAEASSPPASHALDTQTTPPAETTTTPESTTSTTSQAPSPSTSTQKATPTPEGTQSAVDPGLGVASVAGQPAWLKRLNALRALNGAAPVTEDKKLSASAALHSKYMALNRGIGHDESPGAPGYTAAGRKSAQSSNVAMGAASWSASKYIDVWATAPFHAIGMLRPGLKRVGFASYKKGNQSYATLDVLQGLNHSANRSAKYPRYWPTGKGVSLYAYSGHEWPDPTKACGGGSGWGLPMIADFGDAKGTVTSATTTLYAAGTKVSTCTTLAKDHGGNAWALGKSRVLIMPRAKLKRGTKYTGSVRTNLGTVKISFTTR